MADLEADDLYRAMMDDGIIRPAEADPGQGVDALPDYDAGLLNDWGGGNVEWWWDYLRAEIGRANDHWREAITALRARLPEQDDVR